VGRERDGARSDGLPSAFGGRASRRSPMKGEAMEALRPAWAS
jgi:hypothetical protein